MVTRSRIVRDRVTVASATSLRSQAAAVTIGATVLTSAGTALREAAQRRGLHVANPMSS
jgi:hypothetical protein